MTRIIQILFIWNLLFAYIKCETPLSCYAKNYKRCITSTARCTSSQASCAKTCSSDSSCSTNCCYENYCVSQSTGFCSSSTSYSSSVSSSSSSISSSSTPSIAIILPVVFGSVIFLSIICICIQKRRRQQILQKATQQAALNNNAAMQNNLLNMEMANQNQQFQQQMPNQQMYYANQQFQPYVQPVQPIQQMALQQNNLIYDPNQQQIYPTSQQQQIYMPYQPQQQAPGIYEAKLGQPYSQQAPGATQYLQNPTNNPQTSYL